MKVKPGFERFSPGAFLAPTGQRNQQQRLAAGRLTDAANSLLQRLKDSKQSDYVFPGKNGKKPFFDGRCLRLLKEMGHKDLTVHGFRSTFRDWAAEQTSTPSRIAEAALAHVVGDQTEAAYQRGDLLKKRRLLMQSWSEYCARTKSAKVVHMGQRNAK